MPSRPHPPCQAAPCVVRTRRWCRARTSGEIDRTALDGCTRRPKPDGGAARHGQRVGDIAPLLRELLIVGKAQQHMGGFAPVRDEHRPPVCGPFRLARPLVELPARYGSYGHFPGPRSAARFASLAPWLNSRLDMVVMVMARLACPNGVETLLQLSGRGKNFRCTRAYLFKPPRCAHQPPRCVVASFRCSTAMALLAVVASVSMVPVRSAPSMAVTLLDSAAIAITFGMRRRSLALRPITRSCIGVFAGWPWMSMKS